MKIWWHPECQNGAGPHQLTCCCCWTVPLSLCCSVAAMLSLHLLRAAVKWATKVLTPGEAAVTQNQEAQGPHAAVGPVRVFPCSNPLCQLEPQVWVVCSKRSGGGKPAGSQDNIITQITSLRHSHRINRNNWEYQSTYIPCYFKSRNQGPAIILKLFCFSQFMWWRPRILSWKWYRLTCQLQPEWLLPGVWASKSAERDGQM